MDAESFANLSLNEFLGRLASEAPTPGGGSAAALTGALAAALGQMACALTVGRPKFAAVAGQVRDIARRLARAGPLLCRLMDEDAAAYLELSAAFKLDQSNAARAERIQQAAALAAQIPLETATLAHRVRLDLERLVPLANPHLRSDVEAGMHLAHAATHAAVANVRANLPAMQPEAAGLVRQELERLLEG